MGAALLLCWQTRPALRRPLLAVAACFLLPLPALFVGQPSVLASFTIGSMFTWALVALWIAVASNDLRAYERAGIAVGHSNGADE